ncbi:MAG: queuosine salvage family protein, partial [Ktedonobacterales bacterium]
MTSAHSNHPRPGASDPLGVLSAAASMLLTTSHVTIDHDAIVRLVDQWASAPWPDKAGLDELHFNDGTERTVNWILLLDALNFCFWGEPGRPRWRVEWRGNVLDGYAALAAAL